MLPRSEEITCLLDNGVCLELIDTPEQAKLQADTTLFWRPFEDEHWPLYDVVSVSATIMTSPSTITAGTAAIIIAAFVSTASWPWGLVLGLIGLGLVYCGWIIGTMVMTIYRQRGSHLWSWSVPLGRPTAERIQMLNGFIEAVNEHLKKRRAFEASVKYQI